MSDSEYKVGNKKPPKHAQFKKGQSGNPEGGRRHNPIRQALGQLTVKTYREVIELVLTGNVSDLTAMILDPKTPAIQVGVATAFKMAIQTGDYGVIERIAERIVGKIPDELNVSSLNFNANLHANIDNDKVKAALALLEKEI